MWTLYLSEHLFLSLSFIVLLIVSCYVRRRAFERKYPNLPPGPWCWPIIGYLPYPMMKKTALLTKLCRKYNGIFGLYVGNKYVVVMDNWPAVRDSFSRDALLDRPPSSINITEGQPSIIDMNGPGWREQRKFQINSFRLLGAFTREFEDFVRHNASDAVKQMKRDVGKDVNTQNAVELALNNVTFRLLYGKSFESYHPLIRLLTDYDNAVVQVWSTQTLTVFMPWLLKLMEFTPAMRHARKVIGQMDQVILDEIKEHAASLHPDDPRDYIDKYLIEMNNPGCHPSYTMDNLIGNVKILLEASSETTNVSLAWFLLCMAEYQDIQEKVYQEIHNVIGGEVQPQYSDRHKLPFTLASLQESMRWKNLMMLNVSRQTNQDMKVAGYDIPKDTIIIHNMDAHFHNPKLWSKPDVFDPYRFLSKDEKTVITPEYFIPFSVGSRMCPGDKLGKINTFIFAVSVMQMFHVFPPTGGVNFDVNIIFNSHPAHSYVRFELRK